MLYITIRQSILLKTAFPAEIDVDTLIHLVEVDVDTLIHLAEVDVDNPILIWLPRW